MNWHGFVRGSDYDTAVSGTRTRFGPAYPELDRFGARYLKRAGRSFTVPTLKVAGSYGDARVLANEVRQMIELKIAKAKHYHNAPLWLALYMEDRAATNEFSMNVLHFKALEFDP